MPGALFLVAACVVFQGAFGFIPSAAVHFYFYSVFAAGILLAWRFHSSRILFGLLTLFLAQRALEFFSSGHAVSAGPGRIALEAVAFLLPLNFIAFSVFRRTRTGFPRRRFPPGASILRVGVCGHHLPPRRNYRPGVSPLPLSRAPALDATAFAGPAGLRRGSGSSAGAPGTLSQTYGERSAMGPAGDFSCVPGRGSRPSCHCLSGDGGPDPGQFHHRKLLFSGLPRRTDLAPGAPCFNDALLRLEEPYAVAVVDIDHFKNFNDTYGHETGDQVLRMVAAKLASVTGGGRAYRVGGEEFSILFPGKSVKEAAPHLELLRSVIEVATFRVRGGEERRGSARAQKSRALDSRNQDSRSPDESSQDGSTQETHTQETRSQETQAQNFRSHDRRSLERRARPRRPPVPRKRTRTVVSEPGNQQISVTVSIGAAEPNARLRSVEHVIQAADQALYRAKQSGRNRVELSSAPRAVKLKRNIA